jgi:hypothetical protein
MANIVRTRRSPMPSVPPGRQRSDQLVDGERNLHGGEEEFLFTVKVVMDESHIDPLRSLQCREGKRR